MHLDIVPASDAEVNRKADEERRPKFHSTTICRQCRRLWPTPELTLTSSDNSRIMASHWRSHRRTISMITQSDIFSTGFHRGLLSAVFVIGMMLPATACCCSSSAISKCCLADTQQDCCCDRASDCGEAELACCHSPQSSEPDSPCSCCCVERPATDGIVAQHQRIELKHLQILWLAATPLSDASIASLTQAFEGNAHYSRDPCAHNLRQAILCVWRN
jgi:hypothetical protein